MSSLFIAFLSQVASSFLPRAALQAEILALRHQLTVLQKNAPPWHRSAWCWSQLVSCCSFALGERSGGRRRSSSRRSSLISESASRLSYKRLSFSTPIFRYHKAISVRFQQPVLSSIFRR